MSNGTNATDKATVMTPGNEHMSSRALTENLFQHTTGEIFAVWFWYIILGPFGAVFYYALYSLLQSASRPDSEFIGYRDAATKLLAVINWLPVRIAGLGYALMGNFMAGFQFIMRHFRSGIAYNDAFTVESVWQHCMVRNMNPPLPIQLRPAMLWR
ncbi:MAG: regulatory signaling modulator protein AmpE [Coxiellaceae bacterium]|nr:MAG: regulatory signaling modulator protein AmpE [Coxiellaceae bacterium]